MIAPKLVALADVVRKIEDCDIHVVDATFNHHGAGGLTVRGDQETLFDIAGLADEGEVDIKLEGDIRRPHYRTVLEFDGMAVAVMAVDVR